MNAKVIEDIAKDLGLQMGFSQILNLAGVTFQSYMRNNTIFTCYVRFSYGVSRGL